VGLVFQTMGILLVAAKGNQNENTLCGSVIANCD